MTMQSLDDASHLWDDEVAVNEYGLPLNPDAKTDKKLWADIDPGELIEIGGFVTAKSPDTHKGPFLNAIDFLVLDGNDVLAAQDGVIIEVVEDSAEYGDGEAYRYFLNYITIEHPNGEFTQYGHLAKDSVKLAAHKVGDHVRQGDVVGKVGKTGWTDRDHLHFVVFRLDQNPENPHGFKSLMPRWK